MPNTPSWTWNLGHLSKDEQGYVHWRGTRIEHFSFNDPMMEMNAAEKLAALCKHYEELGVPVNGRTAISQELFLPAIKDSPWLHTMLHYYAALAGPCGKPKVLVCHLPDLGEGAPDAVAIIEKNGQFEMIYDFDQDYESAAYRMFHALQREGYISVSQKLRTYESFVATMEKMGLTPEVVAKAVQDATLISALTQTDDQPVIAG